VPRYKKKMCKENWNELKFNYKKLLIMTRELDTMYIIMGNDDARVDKCHYPHQLNQEYYKTIFKTREKELSMHQFTCENCKLKAMQVVCCMNIES
jgi:hypothetical protein